MSRVIVTVKRYDQPDEKDLEVPSSIRADLLADAIAHALQWTPGIPIQLRAEPLRHVLRPDETLQEAQVEDGAFLILEPRGVSNEAPQTTEDGPVVGWRGVGQAVQETPKPGEGFTWKRLD